MLDEVAKMTELDPKTIDFIAVSAVTGIVQASSYRPLRFGRGLHWHWISR